MVWVLKIREGIPKIVLVLGILSLANNLSFAAEQNLDLKQTYELRKQCGESAVAFARRWKLCEGTATYENHYNRRLNICFILIKASCKSDNDRTFRGETLIDVDENKEYANYIGDGKLFDDKPAMCYVGNNSCKSYVEFLELIKPYMNE